MIEIIKPVDEERRKRHINALTWQIEHDTNDKDREIHIQALREILMGKKGNDIIGDK